MTRWIALFRGINVGGKNVVGMRELRAGLAGIGAVDVATYIQSGNAVFEHALTDPSAVAARIVAMMADEFDLQVDVHVVTRERLEAIAKNNPFGAADGKSVHAFFLASPPDAPDLEGLASLRGPSEEYVLEQAVLYLHAPEGIGRSKLAAGAEKRLGVSATARNWRTVTKLLELAGGR